MLETFELVVRGLQCLVGHHQHVDTLFEFDLGNLGPLFVEQEGCDLNGYLA